MNPELCHTIEIDPVKAPIAKRMFELYASGGFSLQLVWKTLKREFDVNLSKSHVEKLLKTLLCQELLLGRKTISRDP